MFTPQRSSQSARVAHHTGDIVAPLGQYFPKGIVRAQRTGNQIVVEWPDGTWTKQHARELRKAA